jgi:hypothetical protein
MNEVAKLKEYQLPSASGPAPAKGGGGAGVSSDIVEEMKNSM